MHPSPIIQITSQTPAQPTLRIYVHNQGHQRLPVSDLVLMQAEANYSWLIWTNGKRILMPRTLKHYEALLPADGFIRLHRNYSVNVNHILQVRRTVKSIDVKLSNGLCLTVARRRWSEIRKQLLQFSQLKAD